MTMTSLPFEPAKSSSRSDALLPTPARGGITLTRLALRVAMALTLTVAIIYWRQTGIW